MSARARRASAGRGGRGSSRPRRCRLPGRGASVSRAAGGCRRSSRSRASPRPARSPRGGRAGGQPAGSSLVLLLDEAQPVLDLRQAEFELLVLAPGDEAQLAEEHGERCASALAHAYRVPAPAAHDVVHELSGVLARELAPPHELLNELVRALL